MITMNELRDFIHFKIKVPIIIELNKIKFIKMLLRAHRKNLISNSVTADENN